MNCSRRRALGKESGKKKERKKERVYGEDGSDSRASMYSSVSEDSLDMCKDDLKKEARETDGQRAKRIKSQKEGRKNKKSKL